MRAARLLEMLLVLQNRGRVTAADLAQRLEVSERTIRRDVEALSGAGVPIYATPGANGGIELLGDFQTRLTGLTPDEALCIGLAGQPELAHRLGLGAPAGAVAEKLVAALPEALATSATSLSAWLVHDPDPWAGSQVAHGELRRLVRCIREHRVVEVGVGEGPAVARRPLGLALKAGSWYLVDAVGAATEGDDEGDPGSAVRIVAIDGLRSTRITRHRFEPPGDFDLQRTWARWRDARLSVDPPGGEYCDGGRNRLPS